MLALFKPFGVLATKWQQNEFFRAQCKLSALYTLIIAVLLLSFSFVLAGQVQQRWQTSREVIPELLVRDIASKESPEKIIVKIDREEREHRKVYEVYFSDTDKVLIDAHTGKVLSATNGSDDHSGDFLEEFFEVLFWLNAGVLVFVAGLSYWFAGITLRPIKEKMEKEHRFMADAAHELRNPLAAMSACAESVLRQPKITEKDSREILTDMLGETQRLSDLTESLLVSSGQEEEAFLITSLTKRTRDVAARLEGMAAQKKCVIQTEFADYSTRVRPLAYDRLVYNLLHNAIKFSSPNSTIHVRLLPQGILEVEDQGIGITPEQQKHLFERFYKADVSRNLETGGSGLGLSIVQDICHAHQWKIRVRSTLGEGSTFRVFFQ